MSDQQQRKIYQTDGDRYEALIAREDHQGHILSAIANIRNPQGLDIYDLGAGTGRLAYLLAPYARSVRAFDISAEMLRVCRSRFEASGLSNWQVDIADHRTLPVDAASADMVVSGWSVSYLAVWNEAKKTSELDVWLNEMKRVLRPGGVVILFESLGTGNESPIRLEHVESTYRWLEANGFQSTWIRTDYKFVSLAEAEELSRFFFGDALGDTVKQNGWEVLPECTGVWWKQL